jgi:chemotaxis protein histidine kinase CheA
MTQPLGIDDFFALEAGEYLDRLSGLVAHPGPPSADELVRFTRALRGSALMANQQAIARAAGGLEHLVRGYRDGRRPWDGDMAALFREATDVLRTLVERARIWTPEDGARAERLALHLERSAGGAPRPVTAPSPSHSETGVRAFLAREAAALGSVLDQAGRSLHAGSVSGESIQGVLRRMQPLRGLAALSDYPPLPDLLDGIERTVLAVGRLELPPKEGALRLDAAAAGLSRAARDIADRGHPDANAEEFRQFADLLLAPPPQEAPIVPIEALFFSGEDGIVQRGATPRATTAASLGAAAVVSRGEHLCQSADEIAEASSAPQRDLRLHVLATDLRTLASGLPAGLEIAVEAFAVSARAAIARGAAAADPARYADLIREAGSRLRGYTEVTQPTTLAGAFDQLIVAMDLLEGPATSPPETLVTTAPMVAIAVAVEEEVVSIESLAPDEPEIVPIEALAPSDDDIVPIESLEYDQPESLVPVEVSPGVDGDWDLAASYALFEELRDRVSVATAPAPAPVRPPAPAPAAPPIRPVAAPTPPVPPPAPALVPVRLPEPEPVEAELPVVEIAELLYHGRSALERADQVQRAIRSAVSAAKPMSAIQPLMDELLDLVELAIAD